MPVTVRPIAAGDWEAVAALEADAYPTMSEGRALLESRARSSPATCFLLDSDQRVAGYLLALPYPDSQCPDLSREEQTRFLSRNLHLHDIVIAREFRGLGLGHLLVRRLMARAKSEEYDRVSLVALEGSVGFWSDIGFRARPLVFPPSCYGGEAVYMRRSVHSAEADVGESRPAVEILASCRNIPSLGM